ncbi:MAG: AI-2E family transporter [Candidatus Moranbacteria bacterium]|nr:AI-2E family transporter [Candidatus Moranbacteria bacterium]
MNSPIEISSGTILRTIFMVLLLWFLFLIRGILVLVFMALIIVCAIDPIVDWLQRKRVPRALSVFLIYILAFSIVTAAIYFLVSPLSSELNNLGQNFPVMLEKVSEYFQGLNNFAVQHNVSSQVSNFSSNFNTQISQLGTNLFSGTISFIGGIFSFVVILSISFYMSVQEKGVKKFFTSITPKEHEEYISALIDRIEYKMGRWLLGQLALIAVVFTLDYVGMLIIGMPYALILALVAGLLEVIPYVGPIVSIAVAALIGFFHNPWMGVSVLVLFTLVQQLEGNAITPLVMKKAVGLNPVIVIVALLVGFELGGIIGALIAIPVATVIWEILRDVIKDSHESLPAAKKDS